MSNKREEAGKLVDLSKVDEIVARLGKSASNTIPILQAIQDHYRYLPKEALRRVCGLTEITPATIAGVATFYTQFRHQPVGRHLISVCDGTACHVKGSERVYESLERHLKLKPGEDTDSDGVFTVQKVACLGCCTLAPAMQIDGVTYGHLTADNVARALADFLELEKRKMVASKFELPEHGVENLTEIRVGVGSCCIAGGSVEVRKAIENTLERIGVPAVIKPVGCVGMCHQTPLVEIVKTDGETTLYAKVKPEAASAIVERHFQPAGAWAKAKQKLNALLERLVAYEAWEPVTRYAIDVREENVCAFLGKQKRLATEWSGSVDPMDMAEYEEHDGFAALRKCLQTMKPEEIIAVVKESGLRGRGGAGFPTGRKWELVRAAEGAAKHIVCNGDEGDPGAFMDRMLMESYPYRVLEGMIIAAYAVGASEGFLYIRAEYPLAVKRIREAISRLEAKGLLGAKIAGSDFSLSLKVMEGAGAFVCGEETALMASIEGRRGMPRYRPPYPAQSGLWGKPTNINNVETYALVPWIMRNGAQAFAALGAGASRGTKVFALAGQIVRGGLIEVPMGITLHEIVETIGGGVPEGRKLKAVQIGGPSGGCIPAENCNISVDYEALTGAGAIMGSGGLVVIDDSSCMVDVARYFLQFTQNQSCGKCTFCRVGTRRLLDIIERICAGHGKPDDLKNLEELSHLVKRGSMCGLGQTAPNPVLSTLRYFRQEYEEHLKGNCPAGRCKALISYVVTDDCIGCTLCAQHCPVDAIAFKPHEKHEIDDVKCTRCDTCKVVCPVKAIKVEKKLAAKGGKKDAG